jgi:hypothetical protein
VLQTKGRDPSKRGVQQGSVCCTILACQPLINALTPSFVRVADDPLGEPLPSIPVIVRDLAQELSLHSDTCIEILRERGLLTGRRLCAVDLGKIPDGLNAKGTERFLRENGMAVRGR